MGHLKKEKKKKPNQTKQKKFSKQNKPRKISGGIVSREEGPGDLPVTVGWLLTWSQATRPRLPMWTECPPVALIRTGLAVNMRRVPEPRSQVRATWPRIKLTAMKSRCSALAWSVWPMKRSSDTWWESSVTKWKRSSKCSVRNGGGVSVTYEEWPINVPPKCAFVISASAVPTFSTLNQSIKTFNRFKKGKNIFFYVCFKSFKIKKGSRLRTITHPDRR